MSLDPSAVAVHERTTGPVDDSPLDPGHWWHETWAAATTPAVPVGDALVRPRSVVGGSLGSLASRSQLPAWLHRVRTVVWPDACSHSR